MPFVPFHRFFPDVARRETRSITVRGAARRGLPDGEYGFIEMYCNERGCDCRRVFFYIVSTPDNQLHAVVAYGWETRDFYVRWMHDDDPDTIAALMGPCLNLGSPQSRLAPALLRLVRDVLLSDTAYVGRVKRHYRMVRDRIDGPRRPATPTGEKQPRRRRRPRDT